jgi:hypothetical protein
MSSVDHPGACCAPGEHLLARLALPASALAAASAAGSAWLFIAGDRGDLRLRWLEKSYVLQGIDPLGAGAALEAARAGLPDLGASAGYAPWSYLFAMVLAPTSDFGVATAVFALLNAIAFAWLAVFGAMQARRYSTQPRVAWCAAAAAVAFVAIPVALRHANYGLVVTALLAAMIACLEARRAWLAGVCLGLAMVKPQLAALFVFVPLARQQWQTVVGAVAVVVSAWTGAAVLAGSDPLGMLLAMLRQGSSFHDTYRGVLSVLSVAGFPEMATTLAGFVAGAAASAALCWRHRGADLVTLAASPAVFSTLWAYHRTHDLMVLAFLGLAVLRAIVVAKPAPRGSAWLLVVSPWLPYLNRFNEGYLLPTAFRLLWLLTLVWVLKAAEPHDRAPSPTGSMPRSALSSSGLVAPPSRARES